MGHMLGIQRDLAWSPMPNEVRLVLAEDLPPVSLITSAFAFAFDGDRLLMAQLRQRGWDIPGGHVEAEESPEQTMRREVYEETGARLGSARLFAHMCIRLLGPVPADYRYPGPESYQVFYCASVVALDPLAATEEVTGREAFRPDEAAQLPWIQKNEQLYLAARAYARRLG